MQSEQPPAEANNNITPAVDAPYHPEPVSVLLHRVLHEWSKPTIAIGDLVKALGSRSYSVLFILLTAPNILPIPGLSTVLSIPLIFIALEMMFGRPTPFLPKAIREREIPRDTLQIALQKAMPYLTKLEKMFRPRHLLLTSDNGKKVIGFTVLLLSCVLIWPIIGGNLLPSIAICLFALGLLEKDGNCVIGGYLMTIVSIVVVGAIVLGGLALLLSGLHYLFNSVFT